MKIRFACGHEQAVSETAEAAPLCYECGESRVTRVQARPPRFTGACSGPYAVTQAVEPGIVNLAPSGPLLKDEGKA